MSFDLEYAKRMRADGEQAPVELREALLLLRRTHLATDGVTVLNAPPNAPAHYAAAWGVVEKWVRSPH